MPENQVKVPDWLLVAAVAIVAAHHSRAILRIMFDPEVRDLMYRKVQALFVLPAPPVISVTETITEHVGSTWLKANGLQP